MSTDQSKTGGHNNPFGNRTGQGCRSLEVHRECKRLAWNASVTDWKRCWMACRSTWSQLTSLEVLQDRRNIKAWHQWSGASLKIHQETEDSARLLRRCGSGGAGSAATARNLLVSLGLLLGEGRDWNTAEQVRLGRRSSSGHGTVR
ncbi:hypothetical protein NL676_034690 [Syzygium grande]|nr:hypothetical protein NL676_034690 [Syzygium grande]